MFGNHFRKTTTLAALISVLILWAAPARATLILDPAAFPAGTDVSNLYSGVILSTAQGTSNMLGTTVIDPLHLTSTAMGSVFTNGQFFLTSSGSTIWSASQFLGNNTIFRVDFGMAVGSVELLFSPDDTDTGVLQAYDASGALLDEQIFRSSSASDFTLRVQNGGSPIAYILATYGDTGRIGRLTASTISVSEPGTLPLMGVGLLLFWAMSGYRRPFGRC